MSGANVAIVLSAVLALAAWLGLPLRLRPGVAALALAGFVVLARPSPSVLRAAAMGAVGLLALATGARRAALPALAAGVLVLVLVSPDLAASPGFALSVLATAGLLVLAPVWRDRLARRLPVWLAEALAVPAAEQVACGPVVVALSGSVGLLQVPANLLAVPAVAPATVLGVAAALLAPLCLPLAQAAAWLAWPAVAWLVLLSRVGSGLPGAALPWPAGASGGLLLAGLTVLVLVLAARRWPRRALAAGALGAAAAAGLLGVLLPGWPPRDWMFVMCDVGQGDALVVRTGPRSALVVDAGPDADLVDRCLRRLGVRSVPLVVLTHPHADHVDGLVGVLRRRTVGAVEVGPAEEPARQVEAVREAAARAHVPVVPAAVGEVRVQDEVRWTVLAPARSYRGTRSDANNDSVVLRVEVAGQVLLLAGDVESEAQADLVGSGLDLRADVLKVPHHGSADQDPAFLAAVGARVVLTSVAGDNRYGHPSPQTLALLEGTGARSLRTDRDGDVALVVREGRLEAVPRGRAGIPPRPGRLLPAVPPSSP